MDGALEIKMSLEVLRLAALKSELECGHWEEVHKTIIELQIMQKLGAYENPADLLKDPLIEKLDSKIVECVLGDKRIKSTGPLPKPFNFQSLTPRRSELGEAIEPADNIQYLNRAPVASMRVCGWEGDSWFADGQDFIQFWNRLHPESLPCIEGLKSDEKLVAVIYASLQGIESLLSDLILILEQANVENEQSRVIDFMLYRDAYMEAVKSLLYLCPIFANFCRVLSSYLESTWLITEHMRVARIDVSESQRILRNAAFHRIALVRVIEACKTLSTKWFDQKNSPTIESDRLVLASVKSTISSFENLSRSLSGDIVDPYGFLTRSFKNIRHSFRGLSVGLTTQETVADASAQD